MKLKGTTGTYEFVQTKQSDQQEHVWFRTYKGVNVETNLPVVVRKLAQGVGVSSHEHFEIIYTFLTQIHTIHQGICPVRDVCVFQNELYIIREYIQGISLQQLLFTPDFPQYRNPYLMLHIILQVLSVLEKIHACGIIHQSICPQHIFIETNHVGEIDVLQPQVKIVAFEYARLQSNSLISFARIPVVPTYSAPEVVLKFQNLVSPASDLYSVGVCLYESLTRKPAFETDNKDLIFHTQVSFPLKKKWNIPQELFVVIQKATNKQIFKKPPNRFQQNELEQLLKHACSNRYLYASEMKHDIEQYLQKLRETKKKSVIEKITHLFTKL